MNAVELLGALAKSHKELLEEVKAMRYWDSQREIYCLNKGDYNVTNERIQEGERVQKALVEYNSRMHLLDLRDL